MVPAHLSLGCSCSCSSVLQEGADSDFRLTGSTSYGDSSAFHCNGLLCSQNWLGDSSDSAGNSPQRFCTWWGRATPCGSTPELPISPWNTRSLQEIRDLLFQTFYKSHFVFPNLPHVHFSLQITCLQTRNRVKQTSVGAKRGWCVWGESYRKSWNVKGWRTKHCFFLCRKWKALVGEDQTEDSLMLKRWIC